MPRVRFGPVEFELTTNFGLPQPEVGPQNCHVGAKLNFFKLCKDTSPCLRPCPAATDAEPECATILSAYFMDRNYTCTFQCRVCISLLADRILNDLCSSAGGQVSDPLAVDFVQWANENWVGVPGDCCGDRNVILRHVVDAVCQ